MREIKFRAWTGTKMFHFKLGRELPNTWAYFDTVMQYTGLKDKNGNEIYEGDIVQYEGHKATVYWDKYMWNVVDYHDAMSDCPGDAFSEGVFEIIGNIYENLELLK